MRDFELANKTEKEICGVLKTIIDAEMGASLVEPGLAYEIEYSKAKGIRIEITISTQSCPAGDRIVNRIESILHRNFPEKKQNVELVWHPAGSLVA